MANPSFSGEVIDGRINDCRLLYEVVDENIPQTTVQVLDRCTGVAGVLLGLAEDVYTFPRFINNDSEVVFEYWTPVDDIFTANLWRLPLTADRLSPSVDQALLFASELQSPFAFTVEDESGLLPTAVKEEDGAPLPEAFELVQNYPNPFNPETTITYRLAVSAEVQLDVFDIGGQRVATLFRGYRPEGTYQTRWRGTNAGGEELATGVYFYQLRYVGASEEHGTLSRKMLLLR